MRKWIALFVLVTGLSILAGLLLAHHGRGATYDMNKEISLKGTVTEVLWRNPHIAIFVDVQDGKGNIVKWTIEHSNITTLAMQGYGKATLKAGQEVTAVVHPAAKGDPVGLCMKIIFPDGREIFKRGAGVD
ncbi:MAG: hypothetical protein DMG13_04025 [Acidobacteria bacterium]|nr:MAG: hypothetical protein DMG13_04025 [Acidobacteriota bacterium]